MAERLSGNGSVFLWSFQTQYFARRMSSGSSILDTLTVRRLLPVDENWVPHPPKTVFTVGQGSFIQGVQFEDLFTMNECLTPNQMREE